MLPPTKAICGRAPPGAQFADRVDQQDRGRPAAAPFGSRRAAPLPRQAATGRAAALLRRTRRDAAARASAAARACGELSWRKVSRASASSGSCVLPARSTMSSAAMPASAASRRVGGLARSVWAPSYFSRAGDVNRLRPRSQVAKPLGVLFVLHGQTGRSAAASRRPAAECGDSRGSSSRSAGR